MATENKQSEIEKIQQDEAIRRALKESTSQKIVQKPSILIRQKILVGAYLLLCILFGACYYFLKFQLITLDVQYTLWLQRLMLGGMTIVLILIASKLIKIYFIEPISDDVARYNLRHIFNLLASVTVFLVGLSALFANWYATIVSLGLISLILSFALQTPITSFIGWIYILVKKPYRVGDRIKIDEATGDVIDVSYLDTTLWEFGGQYLSSDHPSGRIIKFPNSKVLSTSVINYSWVLFPYIWDEIKFQIAYQSDLKFVSEVMQHAAEEEVGKTMRHRINTYCEILDKTPVDQLEVSEHPEVFYRVGENTWIEAIVRYLVEPKQARVVKNRLIKTMLTRLNSQPKKVMFPKADMR